MKPSWLIPCGITLVAIFVCCCALLLAGWFVTSIWQVQTKITPSYTEIVIQPTSTDWTSQLPTAQPPHLVTATPAPTGNQAASPTPTNSVTPTVETQFEIPQDSLDTLAALEDTIVPVNDMAELARRFLGIEDIPDTVAPPERAYQVGDRTTFWVSNTDTNINFQIDATLRYVTDHVYFWIEDGVSYDRFDLQNLVETFENKIYPTNREFFGSEWTPGVDGDPHLFILFAGNLGSNLAGYFSSADEYHPLAHEYSNAHEMFLLNSDNLSLGETFTYSVLAHEFQHMIHWYRDRNENSWLNEGFSELAALLNGYYDSGFDYLYAQEPDMQLTDWPNDSAETTPHYGASFLFVTYFLDRFGEDATKALVAESNNGMASVDEVLEEINAVDQLTGEPVRADDVFVDWAVTNYLLDPTVADGRFDYYSYRNGPQNGSTEVIRNCNNFSQEDRQVNQYGADYIQFLCSGDYVLHFDGGDQVGVLPEDSHSDSYAFWSNKGDESDMTLTQTFDFSGVTGPLTLNFWTWYDLEKDYDYLYVTVSEDGENWNILKTPSGTNIDPSGNSYGWGYNGLSGGNRGEWIEEQVDLSGYAGKKVHLRFEYVTDAAVNGEGFLLDDVSIPEINYFTDFEQDQGGWEAAGWVRIQNALPQTFRLALITMGDTTNVEYIPLSASNEADISLRIGGEVDEAILVVTGTTRFTRQQADYQLVINR